MPWTHNIVVSFWKNPPPDTIGELYPGAELFIPQGRVELLKTTAWEECQFSKVILTGNLIKVGPNERNLL